MKERQAFTLCWYSSGGMELTSLSNAVTNFRKRNRTLRISARTRTQLFDKARQRRFVDTAMAADQRRRQKQRRLSEIRRINSLISVPLFQ